MDGGKQGIGDPDIRPDAIGDPEIRETVVTDKARKRTRGVDTNAKGIGDPNILPAAQNEIARRKGEWRKNAVKAKVDPKAAPEIGSEGPSGAS